MFLWKVQDNQYLKLQVINISKKKNVDLSLAKKEFSSNPVYEAFVSEQLDTVALQAILKPTTQYDSKIQERYRINEDSSLSQIEKQLQLDLLSQEIDVLQKENVAIERSWLRIQEQ